MRGTGRPRGCSSFEQLSEDLSGVPAEANERHYRPEDEGLWDGFLLVSGGNTVRSKAAGRGAPRVPPDLSTARFRVGQARRVWELRKWAGQPDLPGVSEDSRGRVRTSVFDLVMLTPAATT